MMPHAGSYPGLVPRIVVLEALAGRLGLAAERALGCYEHNPQLDVLEALQTAGLRGRGGAGFPAHVKWRFVAAKPGRKIVVANGEEGEPSSLKDQWLLSHRPHLVLDGLLLAARVCGAERAIVYLSHPHTEVAVRAAIAELRADGLPPGLPLPEVFMVPPRYVAGEETAACRAINGGPALPLAKPPRPSECGVEDLPTLVSNVETLAHAAWIARHGAARYRAAGTDDSPGTTLVTLAGACWRPGVYEIPFGISLEELFRHCGCGFSSEPCGFALGGWFGGLSDRSGLQLRCEFGHFGQAGSGWGCGAITALGAQDDPVAFAAQVANWYTLESAGQCGVCVKGTASIAAAVQALHNGTGQATDLNNLVRWGDALRGRGACAFLDGAATLARSLVHGFPLRIAVEPADASAPPHS